MEIHPNPIPSTSPTPTDKVPVNPNYHRPLQLKSQEIPTAADTHPSPTAGDLPTLRQPPAALAGTAVAPATSVTTPTNQSKADWYSEMWGYPTHHSPTPASHPVQFAAKPRPQIPEDECNYCHQKGHWKHQCPNRPKPKGRNVTQSTGPHAPHQSRAPQQHSRPPAALAAPASSSAPPEFDYEQFQQFQAYMEAIRGGSPQASALTTTHSGLRGSPTSGIQPTTWIFDSGSSHHMTPDMSLLSNCVPPAFPISIATANGSPMHVASIGSILSSTTPSLSIPNIRTSV
ncbi:uncharacterized protein LOC131327397 [Rhododendron vialii]|uniref:uncharacterized protein LOC131327397 n=1 Tax=Rhododendron vialii TaxID=182163 RepID=UPI002660101F|nr:uncharacterized protein LOC131327397 [Rhododendron vialii]